MLQVLILTTIVKPIWEKRWLWIFYLTLWIPNWLFPDTLNPVQYVLVIVGLTAFAIPHGASDFYLPAWILNPPWERRLSYWATAMGITLVLAIITFGLWHLSINFSIALFSAIIMWHWGSLDTIHLYPHRGPSWVAGSIGRGMLVLMAPLHFRPLDTQELLFSLTGINESFILSTLYSFSYYLLILAIFLEFLAVVINKFVEGRGLPPNLSAHAIESLALLLTFAWVNPLLALTYYFMILHSFRHMRRVPAYIPEARGSLVEGSGLRRNLSYYFQKTNFLTFFAIAGLCCWFGWKIYSGFNLREAAMACILPLSLLLIPHTLVSLLADFNPKRVEE